VGEDRVRIEIDSAGVADVRLNRADKLNALDDAMFRAVSDAAAQLGANPKVRVVVLSGEGRGFCAGLDVSSFAAIATPSDTASGDGQPATGLLGRARDAIATRAQDAGWAWYQLPVPVIAAVHGVCFGGGLQIALGADIRFVTPDARLSVMEMKWGLIPDMSGTQTLRRLLPLDVLKELTYTARIVSGSEAVELGLATHLCDDPREAAHDLAREIAGRSPHAVRAAKQLLNASGVVSEPEGLALEAKLQAGLIGKPNQVEAVKANLQKRDPEFADPS
jgi:enoyl-CoA hydratase/carnithine racemase